MKILYGVQGMGNGHIARARAMSQHLKKESFQVDYLFSGRAFSKYFDMESFGQYQMRRGLSFSTNRGQVSYAKTLLHNNMFQFYLDVNCLDLSGYDLVLHDFEPISAWAARRQNIPSISLCHQNAFRYKVPQKELSWFDKVILRYFTPANHYLGLHWHHFEQPILPPIVQKGLLPKCEEPFFLVYLPFESLQDIKGLLSRFSNQSFLCYHPDIMKAHSVNNIQWCPPSFDAFKRDLSCCQGVIANGGFELASEALLFGKKLLLKPLSGQFEQVSNVATLEAMGLASSMEILDPSIVRLWLDKPQNSRIYYPDVAKEIVSWIKHGDWDDKHSLVERLWQQVDFPVVTHHSTPSSISFL